MVAATDLVFPNIAITSPPPAIRGTVRSRIMSRRAVARVATPGLMVEASRTRAAHAGMSGYVKLVWQVTGAGRVENDQSTFELKQGDASLLPISGDYKLEMLGDYTALMLVFDPSEDPQTADLIRRNVGRSIAGDSAVSAAAAVVGSLLLAPSGGITDQFATDAAINLMCRVMAEAGDDMAGVSEPCSVRIRRARMLVEARVGDADYAPSDLARELGVSRRSLYADFSRFGLTPAAFIRRIRLARARQDVMVTRGQPGSLTEIALRNGFADSSSFSRAFKAEFGMSPTALRANG